MAVQAYFTNNASNVGEKTEPGSNAQEVVRMVAAIAVSSADDNGSTYLAFQNVPSSFVPTKCTIMTDAITGGTDYDLGLYNSENGAVVDKDLLMDGQTLASASRVLDGLQTVDIADLGALKSLAELLALTPSTAKSRYDVVLTANTVGSADGDVVVILEGFAA